MPFRTSSAALAALFLTSAGALAAVPADPAPGIVAPAVRYDLDTVLVVHNWVLCVSQQSAESIVRAREESAEAAQKIYADLAAAKSCGLFPKLGVQLHETLYRSPPGLGVDARAFDALVNIGIGWQKGFVVVGALE